MWNGEVSGCGCGHRLRPQGERASAAAGATLSAFTIVAPSPTPPCRHLALSLSTYLIAIRKYSPDTPHAHRPRNAIYESGGVRQLDSRCLCEQGVVRYSPSMGIGRASNSVY